MRGYRNSTQVFDSEDPNFPDLPEELQLFISDTRPNLETPGPSEDTEDEEWSTDTEYESEVDERRDMRGHRRHSFLLRASFSNFLRSRTTTAQQEPQLSPRNSNIGQSTDFTLHVKPESESHGHGFKRSPNFSPKQVATGVQRPPPTFVKTSSSASTSVLNLESVATLPEGSVGSPVIAPSGLAPNSEESVSSDSHSAIDQPRGRRRTRIAKNLSVSINDAATLMPSGGREDIPVSPTTPSTISDARLGRTRRLSTAVYATGSSYGPRFGTSPPRSNANTPQHRGSSARIAWEPGVDATNTEIIMNSVGSAVTIVDYSAKRYRVITTEVHDSENNDFVYYLQNRPKWSKVRWVNVNGLSWEAISQISRYYNLHRLAIEDMIDIPQRTKVDMYPNHTFCCFPLLKLAPYSPLFSRPRTWYLTLWGYIYDFLYGVPLNDVYEPAINKRVSRQIAEKRRKSRADRRSIALYRQSTPPNKEDEFSDKNKAKNRVKNKGTNKYGSKKSEHEDKDLPLTMKLAEGPMVSLYQWNNPGSTTERSSFMDRRRPLARAQQMVSVEQVSLFLTNKGEVISFFERSASDVEQPILARLSIESTILRESADPALLFQALIDGTVDLVSPIVTAYRQRMEKLEFNALLNPSITHTRDLHLMNTELTLVRNTIAPLTSVLNSLRTGKQNVSSYRSIAETASTNVGGIGTLDSDDESIKGLESEDYIRKQEEDNGIEDMGVRSALPHDHGIPKSDHGYNTALISQLASIYLADIVDHAIEYTQDLDIMRNNTRSMINLVFNTISIQSGDAVRLLSLVTVVFLPLSFLTGYFGMNFTKFESLNHGVDYYWGIAVPFAVALSFVLMYDWLKDNFRKFNRFVLRQVTENGTFKKRYRGAKLAKLRKKRKDLPDSFV